ncbi:MAG: hypothetical protein ABDH32_01160 [Candidatus Caldarchaeales archaeon]
MSKALIAIMAIIMFAAGAYAAANYPPLSQFLGQGITRGNETRPFPTVLTSLTVVTEIRTWAYTVNETRTIYRNSTIITNSTRYITTTLSQVVTSTIETTETITETVPIPVTLVTYTTQTTQTTVTTTHTITTTATVSPTLPTATIVPPYLSAELVNPYRIYFSSARESPGGVYIYDYQYRHLGRLFNAPTRVDCFTFHPGIAEKVYYVDANSKEIRLFLLGSGDYGVVFEHTTYVRCIRFGPENRMYFSEATGAGGNGKIYKIVQNMPKLYYEVRLEDVDGFWAGNFEFDSQGRLYLSSGNTIPASLYLVTNPNLAPTKIATFGFPIMGIRYVEEVTMRAEGRRVDIDRGLLLSDHRSSLYLYDLDSGTLYKIYENQDLTLLSDVSFRS